MTLKRLRCEGCGVFLPIEPDEMDVWEAMEGDRVVDSGPLEIRECRACGVLNEVARGWERDYFPPAEKD